MQRQTTLFIGNDINNLIPGNSWKDLIKELKEFCRVGGDAINDKNKPFPLLYEEIYLRSLAIGNTTEKAIKEFIGGKFLETKPGQIHEQIRGLNVKNIITTNYDFALEGSVPDKNYGIIDERAYSVFRHFVVDKKNIWHAHGDCRASSSINLGYEHYSGQLQQLRNYVTTGTHYKSNVLPTLPLIRRLEQGPFRIHSWADLFFRDDIYIFGFALDFVESDIWWLLTYRARQILANQIAPGNKIFYFIPSEYVAKSLPKLDLLSVNTVEIIDRYSGKDKAQYYQFVIRHIKTKL